MGHEICEAGIQRLRDKQAAWVEAWPAHCRTCFGAGPKDGDLCACDEACARCGVAINVEVEAPCAACGWNWGWGDGDTMPEVEWECEHL